MDPQVRAKSSCVERQPGLDVLRLDDGRDVGDLPILLGCRGLVSRLRVFLIRVLGWFMALYG